MEDGVVAPVVGVGGETRGDEATETGDIDNIGIVGAFHQHEGSAAVHGGVAHIKDLGALLMVEQFDLIEQIDARHPLVDLHLGALRGQLLDNVVVTGSRNRHLDADLIQGGQQILHLLGMGLIGTIEGPAIVLSFKQ